MSFLSLNAVEASLITALNNEAVQFVVVGGRAVQLHGHLRAAKDLDIWYSPIADNASRVISALASIGISKPELNIFNLSKPKLQFKLNGHFHTELLTYVEGLVFEQAYAERISHFTEGVSVPVLSLKYLLLSKRALGRPKDIEDINALESANSVIQNAPQR